METHSNTYVTGWYGGCDIVLRKYLRRNIFTMKFDCWRSEKKIYEIVNTLVSPNMMARWPPTCRTAKWIGSGDGFNGASSIVTIESKSVVNECRAKNSMQSFKRVRIEKTAQQNMNANLSGPAGYDCEFELFLEQFKKCLAQKRLFIKLQARGGCSSMITEARISKKQK